MRQVKYPIIYILILILPVSHSFAQGYLDTHYGLRGIWEQVQRIDKNSSLKKKSIIGAAFIQEDVNGGSAALYGYFKNDSIVKITAIIDPTNKIDNKTDYYFEHENLIYVLASYEERDQEGSLQNSYTAEYFFKNGKLINCRIKSHVTASQVSTPQADTLIKDSKEYIQKIKAAK